jgi:F-type H+-transporting ATPase subunit epsilon
MAETIQLAIVTPDGAKLSEAVDELTVTTVGGEVGVLPGHLPLLAAVKPGVIAWKSKGGGGSCAVGWGFVEIEGVTATVLTDHYATKAGIDPVRVRADLKDIDEKIAKFTGGPESPEFRELVNDELWCAAQLELHGDPPPPTVAFVSPYGKQHEEIEGEEPPPPSQLAG